MFWINYTQYLRNHAPVGVRVMQEALDTRQDGSDVVRRTPSVLQNVEAQLAVRIHVRVEHAREKLHGGGFVRVALVERQQQLERAVLERRFRCT